MAKKVGRPKKVKIQSTQEVDVVKPEVIFYNIDEDLVYRFSYFHTKCQNRLNKVKIPILRELNDRLQKLLEEDIEYQDSLKQKNEIEMKIISSIENLEGYKPIEIDPDKKQLVCKKQ